MPTPHELDVALFEAYARAGQPVPGEMARVTPLEHQTGDSRPAAVHAVRAVLLGAAAGLATLAVLHLRRPRRPDVPENSK
jgi:hypothetical protein